MFVVDVIERGTNMRVWAMGGRGQIEGYMRYSCKNWLIGGAQLKLANGGSGGGGGGVGECLEKRRKKCRDV